MSTVQDAISNPFALMMNPEAVFAAMAGSERLARLHSRVCRPLDKPPGPRVAPADDAVDSADETTAEPSDDSEDAV